MHQRSLCLLLQLLQRLKCSKQALLQHEKVRPSQTTMAPVFLLHWQLSWLSHIALAFCAAPSRFLLPFVRPYGGISWYLACLSPTSAASLMAAALLNWERVAAGVTLQTLWLPVTQGSSFCVGSVLLLLAADVLLFAALTWYSDKVRDAAKRWTLLLLLFHHAVLWCCVCACTSGAGWASCLRHPLP